MSMPRKTFFAEPLIRSVLVGLLVVVAAGCPDAPEKKESAEKGDAGALPRASVTLRVAVVSDESLGRAIDRLRGEWREQTDGEIETFDVAKDADLVAAAKEADLIVFPSRAIGELCEARALLPVRPSVLKSPDLRFEDFLPLVRDHEVVYAQQVMALPIGCPTPLLLTAEGKASNLSLPDDDIELALAYLAWAAPYAEHRSRISTLIESDTFRPRLAAPPFVRALESLVAAAGDGPGTIAWPQRESPAPAEASPEPLGGTESVFNPISGEWEPLGAEARRATLLASSGRLLGISATSRNAATAFRYAAWLVSPENSRLVSTASDNVANCRGSLARAPDAWRASDNRDLGRRFAEAQAAALRTPRFLLAPRLPGSEEYLEVLGKRVREALDGRPPAEALQQAADEWEAIHHARGWDEQQAAYARSINATGFL
ncbi:hypothetical protein [Botrimarina mediterranea]|uniref:hypothetical protein n=1 Tax=Botrimarina mediterranea TaxID=2528022 RepID=UPI0011A2215B|nr:hypothetical protein [Botrimarina mediterranea]